MSLVVPLGDCCEVLGGATPSKKVAAHYEGEIPWATVRDLKSDSLRETEFRITPEALASCSSSLVPAGNVIIATRVGLGKVAIAEQDTAINQDLRGLIPRNEVALDRRYLFYVMKALAPQIVDAGTGATVQGVRLEFVKSLPVPLPTLDEQRRIVGKLDAFSQEVNHLQSRFNDAIESDQQLRIRALEDAFDQGSGQGWTEMTLGDACRLINGRAYKKAEFLEAGPYPVLRVGNFFTNRNWVFSDLELDADKYCDEGDLLYAWSASFGPRIWDGPRAIFHYHIWKVVPDPAKVRKDYLFRLLQWDVERIRRDHGTGSTMIHVTKGSMEARPVRIPPIAVQDEICAGLDALDTHLSELDATRKAKSGALEALVPAMLKQLMST